MSTRTSNSAAPEQRRVQGVNSNNSIGVASSVANSNSPTANRSDASNNDSTINNNASSAQPAGLGNPSSFRNGRTISGRSRLTTGASSSKMHKAEALARFHPKMITAQIISLQCFQYLAQTILVQLNYLILNIPTSIDRIFTDRYIHIWRREGWADCAMILISSLFGAVGLLLIVEKSKKCLDFTVTYFILHLLLTFLYAGFPTTIDWWVVHILALLIMVVLGEYLCSLKEMELIPLLPL